MKKKGFVLLMMVFLLLSVLPASAAEQRVFDNADLLTAEEEQNLQQFCEDAKEEYDIDFAYLTTKDTEGLSTREYGAQFYIEQNLGVGRITAAQFSSGYERARRAACDLRRSNGNDYGCGCRCHLGRNQRLFFQWRLLWRHGAALVGRGFPLCGLSDLRRRRQTKIGCVFLGKSCFEWWRHCDDYSACGSFFRSDCRGFGYEHA